MSQTQCANTIAYVFGKDIKVATRFPPPPRIKGLLSLGQTRTGITPGAAEQFHPPLLHEPAQRRARERAKRHNALVGTAIDKLPRFGVGVARRQVAAEGLGEAAAAPDVAAVERGKDEGRQHRGVSDLA